MDDKASSDLEALNQLYEIGNEQIRRTFDMYLELLDKFNEISKPREEDDGQGRQSKDRQAGNPTDV